MNVWYIYTDWTVLEIFKLQKLYNSEFPLTGLISPFVVPEALSSIMVTIIHLETSTLIKLKSYSRDKDGDDL